LTTIAVFGFDVAMTLIPSSQTSGSTSNHKQHLNHNFSHSSLSPNHLPLFSPASTFQSQQSLHSPTASSPPITQFISFAINRKKQNFPEIFPPQKFLIAEVKIPDKIYSLFIAI
jgi:hypothetical protein